MKSLKHKVLHVFGRMDRGGAELRTLDLMEQEALKTFEFHFATLASGGGALDDRIRELDGHVHSCVLGATFSTRFRRLLRHFKYDIVHSHVHHFSGYILRLAFKEGVPARIAHFRSTGDGRPTTVRRRAQRALTRHWIDRYATAIVAVSEGCMRSAWSNDWRSDPRCAVIYNGLDLSGFSFPREASAVRREFGFPAASELIVHVGTISQWKNQERVLRIFAALYRRQPSRRLLLIGRDGDGTKARIEIQLQTLGLHGAVMMAGERDDVSRLLKAADLMIFPSLREGLPGAVLEACAAGTPVVASDLPGPKEIAAFSKSIVCLPVTTGDNDWAAAAEKFLGNRPLAPALAGGRFDASVVASRFRELYASHAVQRAR
jgi:glycosyltransferase involved in cell wall biosynthesis